MRREVRRGREERGDEGGEEGKIGGKRRREREREENGVGRKQEASCIVTALQTLWLPEHKGKTRRVSEWNSI